MIRWTKVYDNYYLLNYKDKIFKIESIEKLFVYSMAFGLDFEEIEHALLELNRLDHNYAEFGEWKNLLFTDRKTNAQLYN